MACTRETRKKLLTPDQINTENVEEFLDEYVQKNPDGYWGTKQRKSIEKSIIIPDLAILFER